MLVFVIGSAIFIVLMNQILHKNAGTELSHIVETERFKLEAYMKSEIAIALRMSASPLIQWHFLNPADENKKQFAFGEIAGYRKAFAANNVFWISDIDKKYYFNDKYIYTLNPLDESSWWYNELMENPEHYSLNIQFDIGIKKHMLWINAPVLDDNHKPIGIVGTGVNLLDFINTTYQNNSETEELFFFNAEGEITGAKDINIIENKIKITEVLGKTGEEIIAVIKKIKNKEVKFFQTKYSKQIIAVTYVPALNWYITAIRPVTVGDFAHTGMTVLFGSMMAVVFVIFIVFNIFMIGMLGPLNQMVKTITQTFSDWDMPPQKSGYNKNEVETLGDFFHLTVIDQLTGIYNRRYLDGTLKKIIKFHSRITLSVLLIDIDYFKKYNDTYGHDAGDDCLRTIAVALSECMIREGDFVARYGGEEFAVVLPNTNKNGTQIVAERLLEKVRECKIPNKASDIADYVTISIGGTTAIVKHSQSPRDYIKAADRTLYKSKKNGRNRYTHEDFVAFCCEA